jgi:hypothetical protein
VRFLSVEPLLGPVDLRRWLECQCGRGDWVAPWGHALNCPYRERIDWVIVGGESGHGARPCRTEWIRSVVEQCRAAGALPFVKQLGELVRTRDDDSPERWGAYVRFAEESNADGTIDLKCSDRKGGDPDEWPADLRVREFPAVAERAP